MRKPILSEVDQGPTMNGAYQATDDSRFDEQRLLDAALAIVAEEGLGGLTLRPLAKRIGVSVASFSRQIGSKDQLLDHLIGLATRADEAELAPPLNVLTAFGTLPRETLIDITEDVLRMRCGPGRPRAHFKCELVQAAAFNPRLRPALAAWIAVDHHFFQILADRCEPPVSFDLAGALCAFAIDDAARALTMDDFDAYHWLRREGIKRLWHDLFAGKPTPTNPLFERALTTLESNNAFPIWTVRPLTSARDRNFGEIVASIIMDSGADAITHREVARRAGTPHSSLAYHYPLQDDLVELGMQAVIEMVREGSEAAMDGRQLPVVAGQLAYASFAVALAAARRPNLGPIVREMRRRRGENLLPWLRRHVPGKPNIDMANVQTMSSVLIGSIFLTRAGMKYAALVPQQLMAQLGDWPDPLLQLRA